MDGALLVLILGLTLWTAAVLTVPSVAPAYVSDRLDVAIVTAATLVSGAVAALGWALGRESRDGGALLRGSAFAVLAALNGLTLGILLVGLDGAVGGDLSAPGQLPLWTGIVARGACALLLVAAGAVALAGGRLRLAPATAFLGPTLAVVALLAAFAARQDALPALAEPEVLARLTADPTDILEPGSLPVLAAVQVAIGLAFLVAGLLTHRSYRARGRLGEAIMAGGLVVAAFSQVHGAIHPGAYAGLTTTADLLRLAFFGLLLVGVVVDRRDDLRELRAANLEIQRLGEAELARVGLEERARLAREIHDGLAQDLWYAKLKHGRLAQMVGFDGEAQELSNEVETAIDAALAEARQAVSAMREGSAAGPFMEVLERQVEDFADRFGLQAELQVAGRPPELGPRAEAELLRIVQEALTNARRHADATVVRVLVSDGDAFRIAVTDNGRGFRPEEAPGGFGLDSMRQRAAIIGASLAVESAPANGTRVEVVVPVGRTRGHG